MCIRHKHPLLCAFSLSFNIPIGIPSLLSCKQREANTNSGDRHSPRRPARRTRPGRAKPKHGKCGKASSQVANQAGLYGVTASAEVQRIGDIGEVQEKLQPHELVLATQDILGVGLRESLDQNSKSMGTPCRRHPYQSSRTDASLGVTGLGVASLGLHLVNGTYVLTPTHPKEKHGPSESCHDRYAHMERPKFCPIS